jgi:hypothetical protein
MISSYIKPKYNYYARGLFNRKKVIVNRKKVIVRRVDRLSMRVSGLLKALKAIALRFPLRV